MASSVEEVDVARKFRRHPTSRRLWRGSSGGVKDAAYRE
jgi:hypothetical protein